MKRLVVVLAVIVLAGASVALACDKEASAVQAAGKEGGVVKEVVLTGYLTDSNCGAKNAHAEGKACALRCIQDGAKIQLLVDNTLYTLDKVEDVETKLGAKVKVTGTLDEATGQIAVASVEKVKKA